MTALLMFLHGMGETDERWLDSYSRLLKRTVACECFPLFYGQVVSNTPLTILAEVARGVDAEGLEEERLQAFAEGVLAATVGSEGDGATLTPSGRHAERAVEVAVNTYSYAIRYLVRRRLSDSVVDTVTRQMKEQIRDNRVRGREITLIGHSLGTVVALDLIRNEELRTYIRACVSLGSPLGFIAKIPRINDRILPLASRKVSIPWSDFSIQGDLVAKVRISPHSGFEGEPLRVRWIKGAYEQPHSAYFFEEAAVRQWSTTLVR